MLTNVLVKKQIFIWHHTVVWQFHFLFFSFSFFFLLERRGKRYGEAAWGGRMEVSDAHHAHTHWHRHSDARTLSHMRVRALAQKWICYFDGVKTSKTKRLQNLKSPNSPSFMEPHKTKAQTKHESNQQLHGGKILEGERKKKYRCNLAWERIRSKP